MSAMLVQKSVRLKVIVWLLVCGMILTIARQLLLDAHSSSTERRFQSEEFTEKASESAVVSPVCIKTNYLGIPKYISDGCPLANISTCQRFTCDNLLSGADQTIYAEAREYMHIYDRQKVEPEDFVRMAENCDRFRTERGFSRKMNLEKDEEDFPIAFNILAHGNIEQVERLIHALYRTRNSFCVYFDLKSVNGSQEALEAITRCLPNVFSASKRIEIYWGSYSRLDADIQCMKDHVRSGRDWKYLINTAGQAFPIRSVKEMVEMLKIYNGSNDVEGIYGDRILRSRFEFKFVVNTNGVISKKEPEERHPPPPHEIDIVRGSAYGILSRQFVEFILTDGRAKDFLDWSREIFSPDELYFATLHHLHSNPHFRTPGGYSGHPESKPWLASYANWGGEPCGGYNRHGICVFGIEDLPRLINRKEFFVNKFLADFEPLALECIRAWIDYKDSCTEKSLLDEQFYKNLPFVFKT